MKKSVIFVMAIGIAIFHAVFASACTLDATLINQDPYPAIPGDYVKLIFQLSGIENPSCGRVSFELLENYPISFDPEDSPIVVVKGGTYQRDYNSYLSIPYEVRVDEDALDGEVPIEVRFGSDDLGSFYQLETFYLEIEDALADFEIHIDKYDSMTREMTIEILNIAENDVEALVLEIPEQENVNIEGANRVIAGDLDSSEYTNVDFKALLKDGDMTMKILYTDKTGERRELIKNVSFDSSYFTPSNDGAGFSAIYWVVIALVVIFIVWFLLRRRKKHVLKRRTPKF